MEAAQVCVHYIYLTLLSLMNLTIWESLNMSPYFTKQMKHLAYSHGGDKKLQVRHSILNLEIFAQLDWVFK